MLFNKIFNVISFCFIIIVINRKKSIFYNLIQNCIKILKGALRLNVKLMNLQKKKKENH